MDVRQITDALDRLFNGERARIVFWNDPEREFLELLPAVQLDEVQVLKLDEIGALETKIRLERDDPARRYLLYAPTEEPEFGDDWLLDIRLYSRSFRADRASILIDTLGLTQQHLRPYLMRRRKFCDSKERIQKLKALVDPTDGELDLDRKMLAVVTRADQPELFSIVRTLCHAMTEGDGLDLENPPAVWAQIEKFELDEPFWAMVESSFGYRDESSALRNLLIRLFVADFSHALGPLSPPALGSLSLPRPGTHNAVVCLAQWRDSGSKGGSYDQLSSAVGAILHLPDLLQAIEIDALLDVMTFLDVEKAIVRGLLDRVMVDDAVVDADALRRFASRRQAGHWVSSASIPDAQRKARFAVYEALAVAAEFSAVFHQSSAGFDFPDAVSFYRAYETEIYRFDQLYRHFCENADIAASQGWDMLKPLREGIEARYTNGFLVRLALAWGKFVGGGLLDSWRLDGVPSQVRFFERHVQPQLEQGENRRVFVIISDAFRFEAAQELTQLLNGRYRIQAELASQLGVLPSYTALGMASLLPHRTLEYKPNGDVLADGKPTSSLEQRSAILGAVEGVAVKADRLLNWKKDEGREALAGKRVVYVYHDEIDARGDKASTEGDTFEAVRKAIQELADLVRHVVNNFNANYVLITADHGFLFTETAPNEVDKSPLVDKPAGTVKAKKRYLLGRNLPDRDEAWHGHTAVTAKAEGGMEFWVPKGTNRFHFTGGARFVHGGAMLQEVVVPVITVRHLKDKSDRDKTRTRNVKVEVLGTKHKITTQKHRFTLIQMEPVSDRVKPLTLKVAVYEADTPVTNIESVNFDSSSSNLDDRQKSVILTLQDRTYDKKAAYSLVLRDADTGMELQKVDVTIDRAISDDFDF